MENASNASQAKSLCFVPGSEDHVCQSQLHYLFGPEEKEIAKPSSDINIVETQTNTGQELHSFTQES